MVMKLKTQIALTVVGIAAMVMPLFFMTGWLKYLVMFVGSLALNAVGNLYAGTPVAEEPRKEGFRGFEETNIGDCMQDVWGFNGHHSGE